jgi:hypothetical protein
MGVNVPDTLTVSDLVADAARTDAKTTIAEAIMAITDEVC